MELMFLRFLNKPTVIWVLETKFVSWILGLFLPWLERNDPLPENTSSVRFIFLISYAATPERLTKMSEETSRLVARLAKTYDKAVIAGCEFRDNPIGAEEWNWKLKILPKSISVYRGKATSTTDERELLTKDLPDLPVSIDHSIIVGNGGHIRRASMVWEHYHPNAHLCFRSTPAKGDDDLENPMIAQRRWQTWVFANLFGILFYKLLGIEHFAKKNLSQPVA